MKIGKYRVEGHAAGAPSGGHCGYAVLTWDDGDETCVMPIYFDKVLPNEEQAIHHALEQVAIRVRDGML